MSFKLTIAFGRVQRFTTAQEDKNRKKNSRISDENFISENNLFAAKKVKATRTKHKAVRHKIFSLQKKLS